MLDRVTDDRVLVVAVPVVDRVDVSESVDVAEAVLVHVVELVDEVPVVVLLRVCATVVEEASEVVELVVV